MRVAVRHTDEGHPNAHWFAFGSGRILGHTDPMSGQSFTTEQVAEAMLKQAKTQFPAKAGYEHRIETLHQDGIDEDGNLQCKWHEAGTCSAPRVDEGSETSHDLTAKHGQEASTK